MGLHLDAKQRFSCRSCGRCCRRGEIVLSEAEVAALRAGGAAAWYEAGPEDPAAGVEPFEPIPQQGAYWRIRRRGDGACGFVSEQNRCRIQEQLGAAHKPLTCRLFPFQFHPVEGQTLVSASFTCPTVLANQGMPLEEQRPQLRKLLKQWQKRQPELPGGLCLVPGRSLSRSSMETLRVVFGRMLERPGADGALDLRRNLRRIAASLTDLSRYRVVRLEDAAFSEYLELTTRHAAQSDKEPPAPAPSWVSRLFLRGLILAVVAARYQQLPGSRLANRFRLFRLLLHVHGLGPATGGVDLKKARGARLELGVPEVSGLVQHYLRACIETLGTGRRPVLDELCLAVALLTAGCLFGAMSQADNGNEVLGVAALSSGLLEAADLGLVAPGSAFGSMLGTLTGGVEALHVFATGPRL